MWSARLFFGSGLGSADEKLAINGDRIAIYDLATKVLCEPERKRGFTAARWTKNYEQQRIA
jgi:hypothetical protein